MSNRQWLEYGEILGRIHGADLPADIAAYVPRESFWPKWAQTVRRLAPLIRQETLSDPWQRELANFWRGRAGEIEWIVARSEELGSLLRDQAPRCVLCHADIHTANVLLDGDGRLHFIDWDEVIYAPRERDLMFVVDKAVDGEPAPGSPEAYIFAGYGQAVVDPTALAYYRYEWVVQEIGDFGARVFLDPAAGERTKADAVRGFRQLFDPGDVVEGAYDCETYLA